ncbi:hypothetical protein [Paenimyroides aestuarii]|uniref:Uncharacterized protein n=1 Tax=Paenimyroides aestuarii TaxID=2968490 RepID=A0ABY5NVQ1_9FLAO|nr:hypothetical protein [Paenimyroides aestuarii]UUV22620.1 hypothetical protein NPX36_06135 [Paenimyroides aestuarii]
MITIEVNDDSVDFLKDGRSTPIYQIPKNDLGTTLNDGVFSLWINQLLSKNWADKETLYEFVKIVQKEVPENRIDWEEVFQIIESKFKK